MSELRDHVILKDMDNIGRPRREFWSLAERPPTLAERIGDAIAQNPISSWAFNQLAGRAMVAAGVVAVAAVLSPFANTDANTRAVAATQGITVKNTQYNPVTCYNAGYKKFGRTFQGHDKAGKAVEGKVCANLWGGSALKAEYVTPKGQRLTYTPPSPRPQSTGSF